MQWACHSPIRVATHGCPQHVDELVAVSLLRRWAEARGREIDVRFLSRPEIIRQAAWFDVLIDIGGQFDPDRGRFDHHQGGAEVEGRSAAGLLFDALWADDPRQAYLEPIVRWVDRIDAGGLEAGAETAGASRGRGLVTISALLKALGGFQPDPQRSRRCWEVIQPLVDSWLEQADGYRQAARVVADAEPVGGGIFLASDSGYGPGLLEYVRDQTALAFIGFPAGLQRFQVVAVRGADGHNRVTFPVTLEGASFVHAHGFLAAFADRDTARLALQALGNEPADAAQQGGDVTRDS